MNQININQQKHIDIVLNIWWTVVPLLLSSIECHLRFSWCLGDVPTPQHTPTPMTKKVFLNVRVFCLFILFIFTFSHIFLFFFFFRFLFCLVRRERENTSFQLYFYSVIFNVVFCYSFPCALAIRYICIQHDLNKLALVVESSSLSIANRISHMMDWQMKLIMMVITTAMLHLEPSDAMSMPRKNPGKIIFSALSQ